MLTFVCIYTAVLIAIGILLGHFPNLISGMGKSARNGSAADREAIGRIMEWTLIISAVVICVSYILLSLADKPLLAELMLFVPLVVGVMIAIPLTWQYERGVSGKNRWLSLASLGAVLLIVGFSVFHAYGEPSVEAGPADVSVSGVYGTHIPLEGMTVMVVDTLPQIEMRTNGYALGTVRKGFFKLKYWGRTLMFLRNMEPPFIVMTAGDERTVLNTSSSEHTMRIYNSIVEAQRVACAGR